MKRKAKINYYAVDVARIADADHIPIKAYSVSVEKQNTKRYHNTIGLLVQLSKCARLLLDFAVERMDQKNLISNDSLLKRDFNYILKKTGQKPYSAITINKGFTELVSREIMINSRSKKGIYRVRPEFFFNGSEKSREKLIRDILESPNAGIIKKYRREHFEKQQED